jgi:WD40 repeat protein
MMVLVARRSIILCMVHGSNSISVISLLSGEIVAELRGHADSISCLSIGAFCPSIHSPSLSSSSLVFTGCRDASIRVWRLDDFSFGGMSV